jgi:hypothetical protein
VRKTFHPFKSSAFEHSQNIKANIIPKEKKQKTSPRNQNKKLKARGVVQASARSWNQSPAAKQMNENPNPDKNNSFTSIKIKSIVSGVAALLKKTALLK